MASLELNAPQALAFPKQGENALALLIGQRIHNA
jgi:hypothetical protein